MAGSIIKYLCDNISNDKEFANPLVVQLDAVRFKKKYGVDLPEEYLNMLLLKDGGMSSGICIENKSNEGEKDRFVTILYFIGLSSGKNNIFSMRENSKNKLVEKDVGEFVNDFTSYISCFGELKKDVAESELLPLYINEIENRKAGYVFENKIIYNEYVDKKGIKRLYEDFEYIESILHELVEKNYKKKELGDKLIKKYNHINLIKHSFEFAVTGSGEGLYFVYNGKHEPSIWFISENREDFPVAENFNEFMVKVLADRREYAFGIRKITRFTVGFINNLLTGAFACSNARVRLKEIIEKADTQFGYIRKNEGEFCIQIVRNKYTDGSGYKIPSRKDIEWIMFIKPTEYKSTAEKCNYFMMTYDEKINKVISSSTKRGFELIYNMGFNKVCEEAYINEID